MPLIENSFILLLDVHVSKDDVVIMSHDPSLDRTTDAKGFVQEKNWFGDMEHAHTLKTDLDGRGYPIPTFEQTIQLLMKASRTSFFQQMMY